MGGCLKKQQKDSIQKMNTRISQYENNIINMGLGSYKMNDENFNKLYTQMLEPFKLTGMTMQNHYFKQNNSQNLTGLKTSIKAIQSEIKLLHKQLPIYLSNSIFVRQANDNQNFFRALISGADNTPYANGLFLYDIYLPENYPTQCPKMQLITTGNNSIRFNPNLYKDGYVCLSLLGTWRGDSVESWDPTKSNLLQVLLSVQSLVMSEGVYYNEPSHENDYKTKIGRERNIGYSNIVKYGTVKYAINQMIQNPPKEFEETIKLHFAIKSNYIIKTLESWVETAKKDHSNAAYDGLVYSHNQNLVELFKKNNNNYYNSLKAEVDIAKALLDKLISELVAKDSGFFLKKVLQDNKQEKNQNIQEEEQKVEEKDESKEKLEQIEENHNVSKQFQIEKENEEQIIQEVLPIIDLIEEEIQELQEKENQIIKISHYNESAFMNKSQNKNNEKLFLNVSF